MRVKNEATEKWCVVLGKNLKKVTMILAIRMKSAVLERKKKRKE